MKPCRGDVWRVDFNPVIGREQGLVRPALILSVDRLNHGPSDMVTVIPFSSNQKKIPIHVAVNPPEGGLTMPSDAKCDQIRSISTERLKAKLGVLNPATVAAVEDKVRIVLGL